MREGNLCIFNMATYIVLWSLQLGHERSRIAGFDGFNFVKALFFNGRPTSRLDSPR